VSLKDISDLIRELGFPVAVAGFVLWRLEMRLKELTTAITELRLNCALNTYGTHHQLRTHHPPPHGD
jgi:YvrJ-like protein